MSDLVDIEDLVLLDGRDLRAVLDQATPTQVLEALAGLTPGLRRSLLLKLSPASATRLEAQVTRHGPVSGEAARAAQRSLVEVLCRLGRGGLVAFDDPADMMVA